MFLVLCCFTISLGVLSSVLSVLWSLGATVRGWAWTPEVRDPSLGLWTTRELPTTWNINRQEPSQRRPYQHWHQVLPKGHQTPAADTSYRTFSKILTQPCPERLKVCPKPEWAYTHPRTHCWTWHCLSEREKSSSNHQNTGTRPTNQEAFTRHWSHSPLVGRHHN